MVNVVNPLIEVLDSCLRNAIFHSDYSLYNAEVRIMNPAKIYSNKEITALLNRGLAYFEVLMTLYNGYILSYDRPKIIPVHKDFGDFTNEKAVTIIRKGFGLIGLKHNWTKEQIKKGYIPYRIGKFYKYEIEMLDGDSSLAVLPPSRFDRINTILKILPKFIAKHLVKKMYEHYH